MGGLGEGWDWLVNGWEAEVITDLRPLAKLLLGCGLVGSGGQSSCCIAAILCSHPWTSEIGLGVDVDVVGAGLGEVSETDAGEEFNASCANAAS